MANDYASLDGYIYLQTILPYFRLLNFVGDGITTLAESSNYTY